MNVLHHELASEGRRKALLVLAILVASAGCGGNAVAFHKVDEQALMSRWNAVADGVTVQNWNFRWDAFDDFPHPTYKGGSEEAYQKFAAIMVRFLGDNFDYLAENHIFTFPLQSALGLTSTLVSLTEMLIAGTWIGLMPDVQQKLQDFDARMRAAA